MKMRDTTIEANNRAEMQNYYLYHVESPGERWALAVEQMTENRFNVIVFFQEADWEVYGTLRYWAYEERALAEARYLQLQGIFAALDEDTPFRILMKQLPAEERTYGEKDEAG